MLSFRRFSKNAGGLGALLTVGVFVMTGCGKPATKAVVRGDVTVAGKPLTGGLIGFYSANDPSRWSSGRIDGQGHYLVPDAPLGDCRVTVDTTMLRQRNRQRSPLGEVTTEPTPGGLPGGSGLPPDEMVYVEIDKKFSENATTTLTAEVTHGENRLDFTVE